MTGRRRRLPPAAILALTVALAPACGSGDGGGRALRSEVRAVPGALVVKSATCRWDGKNQLTAEGVVRNAGDGPVSASVSVRFDDAEGVRVELGSDSVSDLEPGESARWSTTTYAEDGADAAACEVSTRS